MFQIWRGGVGREPDYDTKALLRPPLRAVLNVDGVVCRLLHMFCKSLCDLLAGRPGSAESALSSTWHDSLYLTIWTQTLL